MQVIGHLGKDCVTNSVNGKNVINFTVAHSEKYKDGSGTQIEKTVWVECSYWTDRTAVAPYLKKGTQVFAEGSPDIRTYTTGDGRQGATITLRVLNVELLGARRDGAGGGDDSSANNNYNTATATTNNQGSNGNVMSNDAGRGEPTDDLPF